MTVAKAGEFGLIARVTGRLPSGAATLLGPGDDAAVLLCSAGSSGDMSWNATTPATTATGIATIAAIRAARRVSASLIKRRAITGGRRSR